MSIINKFTNNMLKSTLTNKWRKKQQQQRPNPSSTMKEVVPPLHRGDFLSKWQESNRELDKVRAERDKYRKIINTKFSKDWRSELNDEEKK